MGSFLVEKLHFNWDEVHEIAEELEHIKSETLINRLDVFLGNPTEDPHGDPIPDAKGKITKIEKLIVSDFKANETGICVGVKDTSPQFLQYLDKQEIALGSQIKIISKEDFDHSTTIEVANKTIVISNKVALNLFLKKL